MNPNNLDTVQSLARKNPDVIKEGGVRWQIFNEDTNGLKESGAIIRVGNGKLKKVLIDTDKYFGWLCSQNEIQRHAEIDQGVIMKWTK